MTAKVCSVPGCPAPNDPEWHQCWARGIPEHRCIWDLTHQHHPKRSLAGKKAEIVACLCWAAQDMIDNLKLWGNELVQNDDGRTYRIFDRDGRTLVLREIGERSIA